MTALLGQLRASTPDRVQKKNPALPQDKLYSTGLRASSPLKLGSMNS